MTRIPYPDEAVLSEQKRVVLARAGDRFLNISRMARHAPDKLWTAHYAFKQAVITDTELDRHLREILILCVGFATRSDYEIHHHRSIAANLGIPDSVVAAIERGDFTDLGPKERAIARFTIEMVRHISPSDDALAALRTLFSDREVIEMVIVIASYVGTAMMAAVTGVEPDHAPVTSWDDWVDRGGNPAPTLDRGPRP